MRMAKSVILLIVTNILVLVTLSITFNLIAAATGIQMQGYYATMLVFAAVFGFGGAFISLFMSKTMAKWGMGVKIVDPRTNDPTMRWIVETVHDCAKRAGLNKMPEVGVYDSPDMNAFATGPSRNNSLVAVSTGLLHKMSRDEVHGVIGHEIAHVANGDMVTMTLIQGVVNTFVIFLSRIVANIVSSQIDERYRYFAYFGLTILFDLVFSVLGSIVVFYYSRLREYRADYGGAKYAGKERMLQALKRLAGEMPEIDENQKAFASLQINGKRSGGLAALLMTHPPISDRIKALERTPIS